LEADQPKYLLTGTTRATWLPVLQGIDAVYITYQPDLAVPGAGDSIREFSKLAVECKVKQLVLLSGRGEHEAQQCEKIVMNAGTDWTYYGQAGFAKTLVKAIF